jgi:hypothetical protein
LNHPEATVFPRPRHVELGRETTTAPVRVAIDPRLPVQGYELVVEHEQVTLVGADPAGLAYGQSTLDQLTQGHQGATPLGRIRDHPDLLVRGVMLDISRDKVPTLDTLGDTVDRLASWRVNQLQLYMEHSFDYRGHSDVHAGASPLTPSDIAALDEMCLARHIELVPNQNCLGHMERWLRCDRYRDLALVDEAFVNPFGTLCDPMTLDPRNPGSLALVRDLLGQLLSAFRSRQVHVGLDETWELQTDQMDGYLHWLVALRELRELADHELLVWADMVVAHPRLVDQLPDGVTLCEWGYEADHPFADHIALLDRHGPGVVVPGTSSWLSILGRTTNATSGIRKAAAAARDGGWSAMLTADWGDRGHLQYPVVSEPPLAYAAAVGWCAATNEDVDLAAVLSRTSFEDPTGELAGALIDLGDAYLEFEPQMTNLATTVRHLYHPQVVVGRGRTEGLSTQACRRLMDRLGAAREAIGRARPHQPAGGLVVEELRWSIDLVDLMARDAEARLGVDGTIGAVPLTTRRQLARCLDEIVDGYGPLWAARNRPGGFQDSQAWLVHLGEVYRTGRTRSGWGGWVAAT